MTDLIDEVKHSFDSTRDEHLPNTDERGVHLLTNPNDLAPGFMGMRQLMDRRLLVVARRGYRQFAGGTFPEDRKVVALNTLEWMLQPMTAAVMGTFSMGVLVGQHEEHLVKMYAAQQRWADLFWDDDFQQTAVTMTTGFAQDPEVILFFGEYVTGSFKHLSEATGWIGGSMEPEKIWDLWIMAGSGCVTAAYLAGHRLGDTWRLRDELDGIMIATEGRSSGSGS